MGVILACGITIITTSLIYPMFGSRLVFPELVEGVKDCRDLFALLAHLHHEYIEKKGYAYFLFSCPSFPFICLFTYTIELWEMRMSTK